MDEAEIFQLIHSIVGEPLTLGKAEKLFGPSESRSATQVMIRPRDARFEQVLLETPADAPNVVVSVAMRLVDPPAIEIRTFEKVYGRPRLLPRLKPDQPTPHAFAVTQENRRGQLLLGVKNGRLVTLKIDRFD